jgi:hypothetical protein
MKQSLLEKPMFIELLTKLSLLWNPNFSYPAHNKPSLNHTPCNLNPDPKLTFSLFKIKFNIIFFFYI